MKRKKIYRKEAATVLIAVFLLSGCGSEQSGAEPPERQTQPMGTGSASEAVTPVWLTPESTPEPTPEPTPQPTPEPTPEATPESTPEATPQPAPEPTPEATPEATPEPTPEPTPEATPEPTPEATPEPISEPTPQPTPEPVAADYRTVALSLIGSPVSALYAAIGFPPYGSAYASSCNGPGDDGELYYEGFTVYTYREGDAEQVTDVW